MDESTEKPALTPMKPAATPKPEGYGAINGLWTIAVVALLIAVVLFLISNSVGNEYGDMGTSGLATKLAISIFSGALISVGVICGVAAAVLQGVREMLRRYRSGEPL